MRQAFGGCGPLEKRATHSIAQVATMRVLLVEDDELLGDGLKTGFEQCGWVADWVRDGARAQRVLTNDVFDVVVLDLGLPKKPGLEVLHWLRARGHPVPVLILTATDGIKDRVTALNQGADDYVSKPFDLDELCARVRALHRRSLGSASPVLRHGAIALDTCTRSVTLDGRPVALSPKEFAILQTLVEHAGTVVPRHRLMKSTYGWDDNVGSNVLEVHIHHLRKKLASLSFKAARGMGYKLE
jgi:two-component system, OmpR family, response regulator QseB